MFAWPFVALDAAVVANNTRFADARGGRPRRDGAGRPAYVSRWTRSMTACTTSSTKMLPPTAA